MLSKPEALKLYDHEDHQLGPDRNFKRCDRVTRSPIYLEVARRESASLVDDGARWATTAVQDSQGPGNRLVNARWATTAAQYYASNPQGPGTRLPAERPNSSREAQLEG